MDATVICRAASAELQPGRLGDRKHFCSSTYGCGTERYSEACQAAGQPVDRLHVPAFMALRPCHGGCRPPEMCSFQKPALCCGLHYRARLQHLLHPVWKESHWLNSPGLSCLLTAVHFALSKGQHPTIIRPTRRGACSNLRIPPHLRYSSRDRDSMGTFQGCCKLLVMLGSCQPRMNLHRQCQVVAGSKLGTHIQHVQWPRGSLCLPVTAAAGTGLGCPRRSGRSAQAGSGRALLQPRSAADSRSGSEELGACWPWAIAADSAADGYRNR